MPTRQILPACCARSGTGNAVVAIALAIADMNSRLAMPLAIRPEPAVIGTEYHASKWRSVAVRRGGYWGYFRRACGKAGRRFL